MGQAHQPPQLWLENFVSKNGGIAGSVHVLRSGVLELAAAVNIPEPVRAAVATVPKGKGMAGLAWAQQRPIQTCNLQEDPSGKVRPGARAVDARGAIALPVNSASGDLYGVVGIAFPQEGELSDERIATLQNAAAELSAGSLPIDK